MCLRSIGAGRHDVLIVLSGIALAGKRGLRDIGDRFHRSAGVVNGIPRASVMIGSSIEEDEQ